MHFRGTCLNLSAARPPALCCYRQGGQRCKGMPPGPPRRMRALCVRGVCVEPSTWLNPRPPVWVYGGSGVTLLEDDEAALASVFPHPVDPRVALDWDASATCPKLTFCVLLMRLTCFAVFQ